MPLFLRGWKHGHNLQATLLKRQMAEREGLANLISLENAAQARRAGGLRYSSAAAQEQAGKQRAVRQEQRAFRQLPNVQTAADLKGERHRVRDPERRFKEFVARKDVDEFVPIREYKAMMDVDREIQYPRLNALRQSPKTIERRA